MSKYCGKYDFYDSCHMHGEADYSKIKVFIYDKYGRAHRLKIDNEYDAVKYYPYLICASSGDGNCRNIFLSTNNYIDVEEEKMLQCSLDLFIKYYRSCKRKKIPFNKDEAIKKYVFGEPNDEDIILVNRVEELGEKATIDGIHRPYCEYERNEWKEAMVELGYSELEARMWIYGFRRIHE